MNNFWNRTVEYLRRVWPYMVSLGGAVVMLVAWFIPSIQDQYDRYESRKVIERYVELGDDFMNEEQFRMAEEAYGKAYELSEPRRLDIEVNRDRGKWRAFVRRRRRAGNVQVGQREEQRISHERIRRRILPRCSLPVG